MQVQPLRHLRFALAAVPILVFSAPLVVEYTHYHPALITVGLKNYKSTRVVVCF
jgi:hypothetical protein